MCIAPSVIGHICSFLPSRDLLNLRLVCRISKDEVDRQLATVTQVVINGKTSCQTFIPSILDSSLITRNFDCERRNFTLFFAFLQSKCPNLRVLSGCDEVLSLHHLVSISRNLFYFEAADVTDADDREADELRPLFPCLRALMLSSSSYPPAFCFDAWNSQSNAKFIQSSDICCSCSDHRSRSIIPCGTLWYSAHHFTPELSRQLKDTCIASSLRILQAEIKHTAFDFVLPGLAYAKFDLVACKNPRRILNSLRHSSNLKVLYLRFFTTETDIDELCSLVSSLGRLKSFSFIFGSESQRHSHLSLPPNLAHLYIDPMSDSSTLDLREVRIYFLYAPSACVYKLLNLIGRCHNLEKLDVVFDELESSTVLSVLLLLLARMTKLQSIELYARDTRVPNFTLQLSHYLRLKYLWWKDTERENKLIIRLDQEYKVLFESECTFTLKCENGHSIKFDVPTRTNLHFESPSESSVAKAAFFVPSKWPRFNLPRLIKL